MAYIDKIQKIMDLLNEDTFENGDFTENTYLFDNALSNILGISKSLAAAELTVLQIKSRINHNILKVEDTNLELFQDNYDDQIAKAKDCIIALNKVCEAYQIPPFYENDMYDERAVIEFVNTFTHAIANERIRSYYKEKDKIDDVDLTKRRDAEEMERDE